MNNSIQLYGSSQDINVMAQRFKIALRGGEKLTTNEALALAQVARTTNLNPFTGEIWYIPGKGTMIGIAGARRLWKEQSKAGGGFSYVELIPCTKEEAGATEPDVAAAFKAIAHDSSATAQYQKLFLETVNSLRAAGSTDPVKEAKEIMGPKPQWVGYGYSTKSETSRMNKTQLARKRAEADALKKCVTIPFGVEVAVQDVSSEYVNAEVTEYVGDENETKATSPASSNPSASDGERPYTPEALKARMLDRADKLSGGALKGTEAQTVAMNLNECFNGNEDKRKAVLFYITGHESAKDLDAGWLLALKKWINPQRDSASGKFFMDPLSVNEARLVYAQVIKESGQIE